MSTDDKIDLLRQEFLCRFVDEFNSGLWQCESPIEKLFAARLMVIGFRSEEYGVQLPARFASTIKLAPWDNHPGRAELYPPNFHFAPVLVIPDANDPSIICVPQAVPVLDRDCRVDFAIFDCLGTTPPIAVELDGHDFHERTKSQASYDKARERALVTAGWLVMRFTGSDVYRDSYRCWADVAQLVMRFRGLKSGEPSS